ncbi:hypothetical protein ACIQ2D_08230 [Lysinibacillus sp. NPDC097287]|uniref:hypothetical protein n=1 Tax=Lysinibacillus sp. NPDC097287 TaxID=3364144 RepID=UPI0037F802F2
MELMQQFAQPLYDRMRITNIALHKEKLYMQSEWLANNGIEHGMFYLVKAV